MGSNESSVINNNKIACISGWTTGKFQDAVEDGGTKEEHAPHTGREVQTNKCRIPLIVLYLWKVEKVRYYCAGVAAKDIFQWLHRSPDREYTNCAVNNS